MGSGTSSDRGAGRRISPLRVMVAGTTWRLFGSRRAAETLLQAVSGDDEQNRMLAGMSLVKAGQRSFNLIEDRLTSGQASVPQVQLLSDIDASRARKILQEIAMGAPGKMTEAARQCIEDLDRIDGLDAE